MFELEDYSSGIHEGLLSKYADAAGPTLDFYVSDSMQDMLDVDIRAEIANVVGGSSEFTSSFDHALEAISAINNNSNQNSINTSTSTAGNSGTGSFLSNSAWHTSPTAKWMGSSSWSSDYLADLGACVNPISVMPLISSSIMQNSPRINLNSSASSPPPASPIADRDPTKSHLTFSPAQMKISAGSMRREQVHAHIPKQIVTITSSVTGSTTAPATMATNSALQRKNSSAVDAVKKDLATELRRAHNSDESKKNGLLSGNTATNTIKLAPGIGGLTFANSATYNKLKQQNGAKSPQGAPVTANGTIVLKRDRDSSPLHNMATLNVVGNGGVVTKRNLVQTMNSYTPKSIASAAHSPHMQNGGNAHCSIGSPASTSSSLSSASSGNASPYNSSFCSNGNLTPLSSTSNLVNIANNTNVNGVAVKPLHQKIKSTPVEPEYPKPAYSYSCLIALALKNSRSGSLPVSEIYSFMCEHFPYFKNAPSGWKNSVRHNLSLNKCFEKIEKPASNGNARKGCLWAMNPERITKMDEEVQKWSRKDPSAIRNAMVFPEHLESLERGEMKHGSADSDVELDSQSEIEETSDLEEHEFDDTLVDNMLVEEDDEEEGSIDEEEVMQSVIGGQQDVNNRVGIDHDLLTQKQGDFDIEVSLETHMIEKSSLLYEKIDEMYDEIEIEDDKEAVRMAIRQADIIEINPADLNGSYHSPKRARLDINYSIGAAGELEKRILPQQQNFKKVIVQPAQTLLQTQEHPQFVIQAIHSPQQFQPFNTFAQQSRRKMQLVSRIV